MEEHRYIRTPSHSKHAPGGGQSGVEGLPLDRVMCYWCDYALGGLRVDGRCPECGTPIRKTLERIADRKSLLPPAPADLRTTQRTYAVLLGGILAAPLVALCIFSRREIAGSEFTIAWGMGFIATSIFGFAVAARSVRYQDWQLWVMTAILGFCFGVAVWCLL